jgi:hypothetical protein
VHVSAAKGIIPEKANGCIADGICPVGLPPDFDGLGGR